MPGRKLRIGFNLKSLGCLTPIILLVVAYSLWIGYHLFRFRTYGIASAAMEKQAAAATPWTEIEGVYHIHSTFSDGRKSPDKIARIASEAALDFIILTDHGSPNYRCLASAGWKDGVLVLAGSELSVSRGHLVALGFQPPARSRPFAQNTELAAREVESLGGFTVIAHPFSKVRWSWGEFIEYSGIELIDTDTSVKKGFLRSVPYLPALLFKPGLYMLKALDSPARTFRKWDELAAVWPIYGYFSADAHLLYRSIFSLFRLHVLLSAPLPEADFEEAKTAVLTALREGRFYNAVEAAGRARGFGFWAEKDGRIYPMGSRVPPEDFPVTLVIRSPFPFAKETRLIYNGKVVHKSGEDEVSFVAEKPGVYRPEVYLRARTPLPKEIPWIVANPIFLRKEKDEKNRD